jgi:hypothetical protein
MVGVVGASCPPVVVLVLDAIVQVTHTLVAVAPLL